MTANNGRPPDAFTPGHEPVILVVDDDVMVRDIVRLLLEVRGCIILATSDSEQALRLSRSHHGTIDLVITDLEMPRLNGMDLRALIMEERPGTKFIMMSGCQAGPAVVQDLNLPYLPKPFDGDVLVACIRQVLGFAGKCPGVAEAPSHPASRPPLRP